MNVFMQGMRRSGTTIVFDALSQDPRFDAWYEPFSLGREGTLGGGSGLQQIDLMDKIRHRREAFIQEHDLDVPPATFNYGAPNSPELEFEPELPAMYLSYLRSMLDQAEHSLFKFTRMYCKTSALKTLDPSAHLVLLVRHPQEVAASYLYGRDQRWLDRIPDADAFFQRTSNANPWNSRRFVECIAEEQQRPDLLEEPDLMLFLSLWKYTFDRSFREGKAAFGDQLSIVRYEEMASHPAEVLGALYERIDMPADPMVLEWAQANLKPSEKACYPDDPRWRTAYETLDIVPSLTDAGYGVVRPARLSSMDSAQ